MKNAGALATSAIALLPLINGYSAKASVTQVMIYRSPTCGCCEKWADHLSANGFNVSLESREDLTQIKNKLGIPPDLQSCHTAIVNGYVIEGHVPAEDIKSLLEFRPEAKGLAVPGMPVGSPGMEMGTRTENYEVILFGPENRSVFANH